MLVGVAEEIVEPLSCRQRMLPARFEIPQPPVSDEAGRIARCLEHRGDGRLAREQRLLRRVGISAYGRVTSMLARHQYRSRGGAHSRPRVELRKLHALRHHAIEIWSLNHFLPITPQFAIPEIVR